MEEKYEALIAEFHRMWDGFPGMARLITKQHVVLAGNPAAIAKGFEPGAVCAKIGDPSIHRMCRMNRMFTTGEAQTDRVLPDRIRGWMPVQGYPEVMVHFAVMLPEE